MSMPETRRPTDHASLAYLHDVGNDLLHDYKTVEAALYASDAVDYCESIASTIRRLNGRLLQLLDNLDDARGGEVERDDGAAKETA